jgi:hypothetical protein
VYRFLLLLSLAGLFAACATLDAMVSRGRGAYVQDNELTGKDSLYVMQGRIYQGMPIEHALAALGTPRSSDTSAVGGGRRIRYTYRARPNAFDPGNLHRAHVFAENGAVTEWKNLDRVPRFDAYYEGGM